MYCTINDIQNIIPGQELINLTNDRVEIGTPVNMDIVNIAVQHADNLIDSALRAKYKLPLSFIPPLVTTLSADIAAYRIYLRRPLDIPEHIGKNYDKAILILDKISTGKMLLPLPDEYPDENIPKPPSVVLTNKTPNDKIFNDRFLGAFRHTI